MHTRSGVQDTTKRRKVEGNFDMFHTVGSISSKSIFNISRVNPCLLGKSLLSCSVF
uniref:Uncharacterized protein n=1 Tax=Arundo donax TaxID=35708 RepID=A0A0A9AY20_ARUDO